MEGSLKLKEISYIHSEAYAAGELKHGTISLIDDNTLVISVATLDEIFDKTLSNIREVRSRGAKVLSVTTEDKSEKISQVSDNVIYVPKPYSYEAASLRSSFALSTITSLPSTLTEISGTTVTSCSPKGPLALTV